MVRFVGARRRFGVVRVQMLDTPHVTLLAEDCCLEYMVNMNAKGDLRLVLRVYYVSSSMDIRRNSTGELVKLTVESCHRKASVRSPSCLRRRAVVIEHTPFCFSLTPPPSRSCCMLACNLALQLFEWTSCSPSYNSAEQAF